MREPIRRIGSRLDVVTVLLVLAVMVGAAVTLVSIVMSWSAESGSYWWYVLAIDVGILTALLALYVRFWRARKEGK